MDQKKATYLIALIFIVQLILVILTYLQYPFLDRESQRNAGIFIALILILLALNLHIYDKAFKPGEDKVIEMEAEG